VLRKLGRKKKHLTFLTELAEKLIGKDTKPHTTVGIGRPSKLPKPSQILERHSPDLIPGT
jgi:hypothetical protein